MKLKSWVWGVMIVMLIALMGIFLNGILWRFPDWLIRTFGVFLLVGIAVVVCQIFKNRKQ